LGVVLHELLTGQRLFTVRGRAPLEARRGPIAPPSALRREVPEALDAVVLRALAREPKDRFTWAFELRDALLPHAEKDARLALGRVMEAAFPEELALWRTRV
jgi:serine/threonine-protein kinase